MTAASTDRRYGISASVAVKAPARVATTAAITLSGEQTIDGIAVVSGDRVLVKDQTDQTTNGLYTADTGTWTRTGDADGSYDFVCGTMVYVTSGTANGNKFFQQTTADTVTVGSSNLVFAAVSVAFSGLTANSVATSNIQASAVTYAKIQNVAANSILGNPTAGSAAVSEIALAVQQLLGRGSTGNIAAITLGSGLSMSGTTLSAPSASTALPSLFRLSLVTGEPAPVTETSAATTVYLVPYLGNGVQIYNGSGFVALTTAQLSLALDSNAAHSGYHQSGKAFDLFAYSNSGVVAVGTGPAWSNDNSRGSGAGTTELQYLNGVLVNKYQITLRVGTASGDTVVVAANQATYMGTFRTSADGQTDDSKTKRFVYNYHGPRPINERDGTVLVVTNVAGTNTITGNVPGGVLAYFPHKLYCLVPQNANTGAATLNINGLGARSIYQNGAACTGGELQSGVPAIVEDDGTKFNIIGPFSGGNIPGNISIGSKISFSTSTNQTIAATSGSLILNAPSGSGILLQVNGSNVLNLSSTNIALSADLQVVTKTPASAADTGVQGTIAYDSSYIYVATGTNTWKRIGIATW